ncbi:type III toxin-antitoxin system ToxN/AbiQ family toxin [Levilactobacillus cerevisiae]|uniref:type III toxin-antitoxin system ToxN/AbiQ family toxin n=1 Tax=Levilactobacillus cerevisiae TaxID=1704076 RepID=UPI0013DE5A6C|nr:type III toxin-antitoxin system ToxN/AbiQ family toxin [Levilactobacillus cerevisiae]
MELVYINSDYITYLRKFDDRVRWNKSHRPYVGIVFSIGAFTYFAPLETARKGKKINKRIAIEIWDNPKRDDSPLSFLLINDMIPVNADNWTPVDFEFEKENNLPKFQLLMNEVNYIRSHFDKITTMANKVYVNTTVKHLPFFKQMCLDFKKLESKSLKFKK